jgi:hypothetical protein
MIIYIVVEILYMKSQFFTSCLKVKIRGKCIYEFKVIALLTKPIIILCVIGFGTVCFSLTHSGVGFIC